MRHSNLLELIAAFVGKIQQKSTTSEKLVMYVFTSPSYPADS
jgi:hypothetical protein